MYFIPVYMCEQIENDEDIELSNTVSVYNGSDDVSNHVTMIQQQVYWSYSCLFLYIYICVLALLLIVLVLQWFGVGPWTKGHGFDSQQGRCQVT